MRSSEVVLPAPRMAEVPLPSPGRLCALAAAAAPVRIGAPRHVGV